MDSALSEPLVFLHLLADRKGKLSALQFACGPGDRQQLAPLVEHPDFLNLCHLVPCMVEGLDQTGDILSEALTAAGCKPMLPGSLAHADKELQKDYPNGIQWVAGDWYFAAPAKPSGAQAASRALALQLVQLVAEDADNREIEDVFRRDPTLSYQLLRLVNSLGIGAGRRITSFSQAIVILGRNQLRRWLNLMLFAARDGDLRSAMLLARVAVRARAMELLAYATGLDKSLQEQAFMAGMFSLLGILFGSPIEDVLKPLMIGEAMRDAVLSREGDLGHLLCLIESAEQDRFDMVGDALDGLEMAPAEFNLAVVQANSWMLAVVHDSQGKANV
jgi:EAL and modified HD-GYP domain-containing signal transduction protein